MSDDTEAELMWRAAEAARQAAWRAACRDKALWGEQLVNLVCGVVKAFTILLAVALVLEQNGVPNGLSMEIAVALVMMVLPFNPRSFFWRNLFALRASAAFNEALKNYHRN